LCACSGRPQASRSAIGSMKRDPQFDNEVSLTSFTNFSRIGTWGFTARPQVKKTK
jgi:hypothetical protein